LIWVDTHSNVTHKYMHAVHVYVTSLKYAHTWKSKFTSSVVMSKHNNVQGESKHRVSMHRHANILCSQVTVRNLTCSSGLNCQNIDVWTNVTESFCMAIIITIFQK